MTSKGNKAGRTKMYATVHWLGTDKTDIVSLCSIKKKEDRVEGKEFMYRLHKKGTPQDKGPAMCKIVKISNKLDDLKDLSINIDGQINSQGNKALSAQQILVKKQLAAQKKLGEVSSSLAALEAQQSLLRSTKLCETNTSATAGDALKDSSVHNVDEIDMDTLPMSSDNSKEVVQAAMPSVTLDSIIFMRQLLRCMEQAYEAQHGKQAKSSQVDVSIWKKNLSGTDPFHKGPHNKCFIFHQQKLNIEHQSFNIDVHSGEKRKAWKCLVRQVLIEVYGSQIQNYCAKGRAGSRPGIDADIFRDLFWFAREFEGEGTHLTEKQYVTFINSLTWNHAKGEKENAAPEKPSSADASISQGGVEVDSPRPASRTQLVPSPSSTINHPPPLQPVPVRPTVTTVSAVAAGGLSLSVCNTAGVSDAGIEGGNQFPQGIIPPVYDYHQGSTSTAWPISVSNGSFYQCHWNEAHQGYP